MGNLSVTINMDHATVQSLKSSGATLFAFKAVQAFPSGGGLPLVWQAIANFSQNTVVHWTEQFEAYTSQSSITEGMPVVANFAVAIAPGQTLQTSGSGGTVSGASASGQPISIANQTSSMFACGFRQSGAAVCAFLLQGNMTERFTLVERVALTFATKALTPGTALSIAPAAGICFDMPANQKAQVSFSSSTGWSGDPSATKFNAGANLTPLLILKE